MSDIKSFFLNLTSSVMPSFHRFIVCNMYITKSISITTRNKTSLKTFMEDQIALLESKYGQSTAIHHYFGLAIPRITSTIFWYIFLYIKNADWSSRICSEWNQSRIDLVVPAIFKSLHADKLTH